MKHYLIEAGLVLFVSTTFGLFSLDAQTPPSPSPEQLRPLEDLADQAKAALQRGDLDAATRLSSALMVGVFNQRKALEPTPQEKLAQLEQAAPTTGITRFYALPNLAKAAFEAGNVTKAEAYARELLALAPEYRKDWNYGNAIFYGNMVIGRVALSRDRNVQLAKSSLLASAQTPGSPQLNSFGPNMSLARDLLNQGERDTALQFFTMCRTFWTSHLTKLDDWTAMVKGGRTPDFGPNLVY